MEKDVAACLSIAACSGFIFAAVHVACARGVRQLKARRKREAVADNDKEPKGLWVRAAIANTTFAVANRCVCSLHSLWVVTLALASLVFDGLVFESRQWTLTQKLSLSVSLGYFLYDLPVECSGLAGGRSRAMIFHHLAALWSILAGLWYQRGGTELAMSVAAAELSTPFLHVRYLFSPLKHSDLAASRLHNWAQTLFALIFVASRILFIGPVMLASSVLHAPRAVALGGTLIYAVSVYWTIQILKHSSRITGQLRRPTRQPSTGPPFAVSTAGGKPFQQDSQRND